MVTKQSVVSAGLYIQRWLDYLFPLMDVPGISIAIAREGETLFKQAWGIAHSHTQERLTPDHLFRVASHSKTFTAVLAFLLAEKGLVEMGEPIGTYLPWIRENKAYASLTLEDILSHGTGTEREGENGDFWCYTRPFPDQVSVRNYFLKAIPVIPPGTHFKYSNYGYVLAGLVLEAVTGRAYDDLVKAYLLVPLSLEKTGTDTPNKRAKLCAGHSRRFEGKRIPLDPYLSAGALACVTGFHSTPENLARAYSVFVLEGKVLQAQTRAMFLEPKWAVNESLHQNHWYSYGLLKEVRDDMTLYGHFGGYPGFLSKTIVSKEMGLAVSVCVNCLGADLSFIYGMIDILKLFAERGENNPLTRYEGRFFNLWSTFDTIAGQDKIHVLSLTSRSPFLEKVELARQDDDEGDTFTIVRDDDLGSYGEKVGFEIKKGQAVSMIFGPYSCTDYETFSDYIKTLSYTPSRGDQGN